MKYAAVYMLAGVLNFATLLEEEIVQEEKTLRVGGFSL
jgi:hypothetical protein